MYYFIERRKASGCDQWRIDRHRSFEKVMSWANPSPSEAEEQYSYYKNKYNNAAQQKRSSEIQEQNYISERSADVNKISSLRSDKINFEKRAEGIGKIIKMLEGASILNDVPSVISKAVKKLDETESSYRNSIRLSGGVAAASLATAFETRTVEADNNSANALQAYRNEKARLEQEIANLKSQIASLESAVAALTSKIAACNATQASLRVSMNSSAFEMNHYRKYMD